MQHFTDKALAEITAAYSEIRNNYIQLFIKTTSFSERLRNERAKEFMLNGVARRLSLLDRCVENIFNLFPPDRIEILEKNDLLDIDVNLHAFMINVYGIIENIGLSIAHENNLVGNKPEHNLRPKDINLFERRFRRLLNPQLCAYLREETIAQWYNNYAKNYRDALAHRIPPYVPRAALNDEQTRRFKCLGQEITHLYEEGDFKRIEVLQDEQERLGRANPLFAHSFSEEAKPVFLHPQLIADFKTVEELLNVAVANFYCDSKNKELNNRTNR